MPGQKLTKYLSVSKTGIVYTALLNRLFYVDQSSLLPSAIQRYHQLFKPALQLVNGVLMTLGSSHQTATTQVRTDNRIH